MQLPTSTAPELMIYVETCPHGPESYVTGADGTCSCTDCETWARWMQRFLERELNELAEGSRRDRASRVREEMERHLEGIREWRLEYADQGTGVVKSLAALLPAFRAALAGKPVPNADRLLANAELSLAAALQGDDDLSLAERLATELH